MIFLWLGLLSIVSGKTFTTSEIECRDDNNNLVDWFYIYKLPKNKFTKNDLIKKGVAYMYITPQTMKQGWILSGKSINDSNSMPGLTLYPLYLKKKNLLSVIYNDQVETNQDKRTGKSDEDDEELPGERKKRNVAHSNNKRRIFTIESENNSRRRIVKTGGGHTKGVILNKAGSGIWLIHSVPKYPPLPDVTTDQNNVTYSYPLTATRYGQSFLCLSLNSSQMNNVGGQLKFNEPKILFSNIPADMSNYTNIVDVVNKRTVKIPPWHSVIDIVTKNGMRFKSFAKSANFNDDIYEALVAPFFKSDILVESWRHGPGVLQSNCTFKYKVKNIQKIAFPNTAIAFTSNSDHSKWAISVSNTKCKNKCSQSNRWVCIGDINRAEAQETRGGGTVCLENFDIWRHFTQIVNSIEDCDGTNNDRVYVT